MRILLFCENKYAIDILRPIHEQAIVGGDNEILWFVDQRKIPVFPYAEEKMFTNDIQEAYDFNPEAIFVPGNIVPYYLPGVKIQVFHGYAAEKKDHWVIRRYFDTYFTQGPFFTKEFERLSKKYKDFEVLETGWPRQDWIYEHRHDFEQEKHQLLKSHGKKKLVLYAPTFSKKLTSLPSMSNQLKRLVNDYPEVMVITKLHPLTAKEYVEEYKQLSTEERDIVWIDDFSVSKYIMMCDVLISDTSSTIYECLLLDKPVVTLRAISKDTYWQDCRMPSEVAPAVIDALTTDPKRSERKWIIDNYDPYLDGQVCKRMLDGARDYIKRHGVPRKRVLNLWRKYTSIKKFGWIKR